MPCCGLCHLSPGFFGTVNRLGDFHPKNPPTPSHHAKGCTLRDFSLGPWIVHDENFGVLQYALLHVAPDVQAVEFGVGSGTSTALMARRMPVTGFDCFSGLPEDWREGFPKGSLACMPPMIRNTRLVVGLFEDTLPTFDFHTVAPLGLVHIDCDLYSSTRTALEYVMPHAKPGCFLVFDEFHNWPGWELDGECRAWHEYVDVHPELSWRVLGHGEQQWAIELT